MTDYLLITGMSGAGRSTAAAALEDAGWYVIDNMPPSLLAEAADALGAPASHQDRVALVMGRAGRVQVTEAIPAIDRLRDRGHDVEVVYLDANDEVLVRRYEGTRRRHPIGATSVKAAIADERKLLAPIRDRADVVIDTGELNINQLRTRVLSLFGDSANGMQISVVSFGYKHGVPQDADFVLDCRFLPNPHWVDELRPYSGLDSPVRDFVMGQVETGIFMNRVEELIASLLESFINEGKSYLTIAIGCTGGRHRSVVLAEDLASRLRNHGALPSVLHRDVDR